MNILMIPQISMRSYEDGRYFLRRDAQINKCKGLLYELANLGHCVFLVVPTLEQVEVDKYKEIFNGLCSKDEEGITSRNYTSHLFGEVCEACGPEGRICFLPIEHGKNVLVNRYMFPLEDLKKKLLFLQDINYSIDFCINEIVPLTKGIYALQEVYLDYKFPVASCMEHMTLVPENALSEKLDHFSIESSNLMVSDLAVFPMNTMEMTFTGTMKDFYRFNNESFTKWYSKIAVWNHYFSAKEIENLELIEDDCLKHEKIILFGSRLSDDKRTKFSLFFKVINELWKTRQDFQVIIANPNEGKDSKWISKQLPKRCFNSFIINDKSEQERSRWLSALRASKIVPILYPMDELYSVGCQEALYSNCHLLTPKLQRKREGMPELNYTGYFKEYEVKKLVNKMHSLLDDEDDIKLSQISFKVSGEYKAKNVLKDIKEVCSEQTGVAQCFIS